MHPGGAMVYDFVAHCRWPAAPLAEARCALWLWGGLRRMFHSVLAAALMPNHLHLLRESSDPARDRERLRRLLAAFARSFDLVDFWLPVPEPELVPTPDKIRRQVRYIALNPCRPCRVGGEEVRLVSDPLEWEWSTHRDAVGAIVDPWVTAAEIARVGGVRTDRPAQWLHDYVSKDEHVSPTGTPFPVAATGGEVDEAVRSAAAAHRLDIEAVRRRGACRTTLLGLVGTLEGDVRQLARELEMHPKAAVRSSARVDSALIEPARLCLGDERLLVRTDYRPPASTRAVGLEEFRQLRARPSRRKSTLVR